MAPRVRVAFVALGCGIVLGMSPRIANASATYPALITTQLALNYTPQCTICHRDNNGGIGTVIQPFGRALQTLGLRSEDPASLTTALNEAKAQNLDSGGDGVPDIEELEAGMNPNAGGGGKPIPEYGCSLTRPMAASWPEGASAFLVALALTATRRRSRSGSGQHRN